jgi:TPR repeat protein
MSPKHLVAALLLGLLSAPVSAQSVKAGVEAWQRADYAAAVGIWRPLAERGDADAQFNLGQAYRLGRGVALNLSAAKTWFERAATKGHLDAQTTLGLLLFQNGEQADGLKWLKQAAEKGEPRAQLVYGTALYNGDGVGQDRLLGYAFVSRAAGQGLSPARDTLSQLDQLMPQAERQRAAALALAVKAAPPKAQPKTPKVAQAKPPAPKPAKLPPPTIAPAPASGAWRIQLGAFSQRAAAEALYQRVSGKVALAGRRPFYIPAGSITRLQVGPFASKAAAASACSTLGVACFPVPAK